MGGRATGAQSAASRRRDRTAADPRVRPDARDHLGFNPMEGAIGGEQGVPVGGRQRSGDQGRQRAQHS
eukprot:6140852-Pleurochrysis_carterae.AAC.1